MNGNSRKSAPTGDPEEVLAHLEGLEPGTALRVKAELSMSGWVRLERLGYSEDLGWYVQKSFVIPRDMLAELIPVLRKADCLMPRRSVCGEEASYRFPGV